MARFLASPACSHISIMDDDSQSPLPIPPRSNTPCLILLNEHLRPFAVNRPVSPNTTESLVDINPDLNTETLRMLVAGLIETCRIALQESRPALAIREIVERAVSEPGGVERALGTPKRAEIRTLYRSPELTIINFIWGPHMSLYPHDHRMWAVIGLYGGREDNVFFRRTTSGLAAAGARTLEGADAILSARGDPHRRL